MKRQLINECKLTFLSLSVNEGFARSAAAAFISQLDPTVKELGEIRTAVSEAVTNAVVHAYPEKPGEVELIMRLYSENTAVLIVRDKGVGISNIEQAMTPLFTTLPDEERSGLGFSVMESFTDKVTVKSTPGKGTTVTLEKKISVRAYVSREGKAETPEKVVCCEP